MEILKIENLSVCIKEKKILNSINLILEEGRVLGIVGKSGSGKTTLISSILNILDKKWSIEGKLELNIDKVALIPQDFNSAFNPLMKIKSHLYELMENISYSEKKSKAIKILKRVKINNPETVLNLYPYELSGGMLQRINIAFALLMESKLIIADEFTSSLDTITQNEILKLLYDIQKKEKKTMIIISHDLKVISDLSDDICVMKNGEIVEYGRKDEVLFSPKNEYTKKLLHNKFLKNDLNLEKLDKKILLSVENLYKSYGDKEVLKDINFKILEDSSIGIIGESGNGKTTLAKVLVGLEKQDRGEIYLHNKLLNKEFFKNNRNMIQIIFQNSVGALNPYRKIKNILGDVTKDIDKISKILLEVGLEKESLEKYPKQFSGGQVQRICIARALLSEPKLLILDEPTSSLDKSTQIQILNLLKKIKVEKNISYLIISHNLEVIESLCDSILVIYRGEIIERIKNSDEITITNEYTQKLFSLAK